MRYLMLIIGCMLAAGAPANELASAPDPALTEHRYCTATPLRDANGKIARRKDVLAAFQRTHPCPATGLTTGRCPGWGMDHVIPLANGGCDAVSNLQWLPDALKRCAGRVCKDRWERQIYTPKQ